MKRYLALDGGATATRAALYDECGTLLAEAAGGPSNPVDHGIASTVRTVVSLARQLLQSDTEAPAALVAGISGAANPSFRNALAQRIQAQLGLETVRITDDLRPILLANARGRAAILAIAGTGSSVLGQTADGQTIVIGARGTLFGDEGSAYQIAVSALRAAAHAEDGMGPLTRLQSALPAVAGCDGFAAFAVWARAATKQRIAVLAKTVTELAEAGDAVALQCLEDQAFRLAEQTAAARRRLALPDDAVVYLHGGLFDHCPRYRAAFERALKGREPLLIPGVPPLRGPRAVLELAWLAQVPDSVSEAGLATAAAPELPPTERSLHPDRPLDRLSSHEMVQRMLSEDASVPTAVADQADRLAAVIDAAAEALRLGGRIIYVGAGTSGRLGVLDASECPPTFGVAPDRVIGIIAGGDRALRESVEGAEDDVEQAVRDLQALQPALGASDLVVGIAASGATPYVRAALETAQASSAHTAFLCCNPLCAVDAETVIAVDTGPEVLTGSTRLKAGTATKLALNMISTGALALAGYVYEGEMVGMRPRNAKLRRRAIRIISSLGAVREEKAGELLDTAGNDIAAAILMARQNLSAEAARERLDRAGGNLRAVLGQ